MGTDNSHFYEKVNLRLKAIAEIPKDDVSILECYAGKGLLYAEVKKHTSKKLHIVSIEKERGKNPFALCGDNLKFLPTLNLEKFDIIDLDAYGIPSEQIKIIADRGWHGLLVVTCIKQRLGGGIPNILLKQIDGVKIAHKSITLFAPYWFELFEHFLFSFGVRLKIGYYINDNSGWKYYFYCKI